MPTSKPLLLAVHPDGKIEFTRDPRLDRLFDGKGVMQRVTDIHKSPYHFTFYIKWLLGPWKGSLHTRTIARNYFNPDELYELQRDGLCPKFSPEHMRADEPMAFDSYEDAVIHEVTMLARMRQRGVSFYEQEADKAHDQIQG